PAFFPPPRPPPLRTPGTLSEGTPLRPTGRNPPVTQPTTAKPAGRPPQPTSPSRPGTEPAGNRACFNTPLDLVRLESPRRTACASAQPCRSAHPQEDAAMTRSLLPSRRPTRLRLECLEDRSLLSAGPTLQLPDLQVNT